MSAEVTALFPSPEIGLGYGHLRPSGTEDGALPLLHRAPKLYAVATMAEALASVEVGQEADSLHTLGDLAVNHATRPEAEADELARFRDIVPAEFAINAESILKLKLAADRAEAKGRRILGNRQEANNQLVREDRLDELKDPVDAMGTAKKLGAIKRLYGKDSPEYRTVRQGLWWDKFTRVSEAFDHNGVFVSDEQLIQEYDPVTDQVFADGLSVDEVQENGLIPTVTEEEELRVNNFKGHAVIKELAKDPASKGKAIIQIWQCPKYAIDAYKHNPDAAPQGYAPKIKKDMIVCAQFLGDNQVGWSQIGVPGDLYKHDEVVTTAQKLIGALQANEEISQTESHGIQALVPGEFTEFDMVHVLDLVASRVHGYDVFMGRRMAPGQVRDYERVREESKRHRHLKAEITDRLVDFVESLEEAGIDSKRGTALEDKFLRDQLLEVAKHDPERAAIIFDDKTADGFREVKRLRATGNHKAADEKEARVKQEAPAAGGCGAGSCGLERVDFSTLAGQKAKAALDAQEGEEVLHDTERPCPECGKMSVYYAYTETYVKKACIDCGAKDFDATTEPAPDTKTKRVFTLFDHETKTTQKIYETRSGFWRSITGEQDEQKK